VRSCLILTGVASDNCVLFTAAFLRDYHLCVPADRTISREQAIRRAGTRAGSTHG
jgi:nicotinamidase-related amidase